MTSVIGSCLGAYLIVLCWLGPLLGCWHNVLIAAGFYIITIAVIKILTSFIMLGRFWWDGKKLLDVFMFDIPALIVSPDYVLSKVCKDVFWKTTRRERAKIISGFNLENIGLSFIFVFFFWLLLAVSNGAGNELLLAILAYRIVSRTVEIVVSFVKDVCASNRVSTLNGRDRIALAFLSILEVIILAFGVGICSGQDDFSQAAIKALSLIGSVGFTGGHIDGVELARLFCGLACFALLGTVVGFYLSEKGVSKKPAKEDAPQLFVMDKQGVRNIISLQEAEDAGCYQTKVINQKNWSYIVNYRGRYFPIDECKYGGGVQKDGLSNNFVYEGDVFVVTFNAHNGFVEIKKEDETK